MHNRQEVWYSYIMAKSWYIENDTIGVYYFGLNTKQPVDFSEAPSAKMPLRSFCYLPDGWNTTWEAAKSASGTSKVWMTVIGDSIAQGVGATDMMNSSWFAQVRANLVNKYPLYGDFYPCAMSAADISSPDNFTGTAPWVMNTSGLSVDNTAAYGAAFYWASQSGMLGTFTSPYACQNMDLLWTDENAGLGNDTWIYKVDGGANGTLTIAGNDYVTRQSFTNLANTTHTIAIGSQNADFVALPMGAVAYSNNKSGLGYAFLGGYGLQIKTGWGDTGHHPSEKPSQLQGKQAATTGFGFPMQPSLCILALGGNDCGAAYSVATYFDTYRRMIQALRRGQANCSIVFLINCIADAVNSDFTSGNFGNSANWAQFMQQLYVLAHAYNCAVVNIHAKWGETPVGQGFLVNGNVHPTDAGHKDIAGVLNLIL